MLASLLWVKPPRWLHVAVCIALGWCALPYARDLVEQLPGVVSILILAGGVLYSTGAIIYARRWPDPAPRVFGYHEVYHALVLGGVACHFVAVWYLLT